MKKYLMILAAVATLGTTALASTGASAWGWHHHHHFWGPHFGFGWGAPWYGPCRVVLFPFPHKVCFF